MHLKSLFLSFENPNTDKIENISKVNYSIEKNTFQNSFHMIRITTNTCTYIYNVYFTWTTSRYNTCSHIHIFFMENWF